jgi:transcription initiation factor IIE alpha subunit
MSKFSRGAEELLKVINDFPKATNEELSEQANISVSQVKRYLDHLKNTGRITIKTWRCKLGSGWVVKRVIGGNNAIPENQGGGEGSFDKGSTP